MSVISTDRQMHIANGQDRIAPEAKLWLAVVEQVIRSDPPEKARNWLKSRDGQSVAFMAGVDPDWIERKFLSAGGFAGRKRRSRKYKPVDDFNLPESLPLAGAQTSHPVEARLGAL